MRRRSTAQRRYANAAEARQAVDRSRIARAERALKHLGTEFTVTHDHDATYYTKSEVETLITTGVAFPSYTSSDRPTASIDWFGHPILYRDSASAPQRVQVCVLDTDGTTFRWIGIGGQSN